jgi:hypothetical protein
MNYLNIIKIISLNYMYYKSLILTQVSHGENEKRLQHPSVVSKPRKNHNFLERTNKFVTLF